MRNRLQLVLLPTMTATLTVTAQNQAGGAFVQASRVALRTSASGNASTVAFLPTNTEVEIQSTAGEWCRVRTKTGTAGFMACRVLAPRALTIDAVEKELNRIELQPRERVEWTSRAMTRQSRPTETHTPTTATRRRPPQR